MELDHPQKETNLSLWFEDILYVPRLLYMAVKGVLLTNFSVWSLLQSFKELEAVCGAETTPCAMCCPTGADTSDFAWCIDLVHLFCIAASQCSFFAVRSKHLCNLSQSFSVVAICSMVELCTAHMGSSQIDMISNMMLSMLPSSHHPFVFANLQGLL